MFFPEEVEVERTNNVMNSHMLNTEESGEEEDDVIPDVDNDNNGFTSSSSENGHRVQVKMTVMKISGRASKQRSTQSVGRGFARGNYRETIFPIMRSKMST
ncbi:hypothetical protein Fot_35432 [Forsythia ovata]|uniref:Uncharacterized protein n=1 Tax=Forsythia ovata TaxID=205694 RepID=A0ABD1SMX8_9LAMI